MDIGINYYDLGSAVTSAVVPAPAPDLIITKSVDKDEVYNGETLTITLDFENRGFATVPTIVDVLPEGFEVIEGTLHEDCTLSGRTITCEYPRALEQGESDVYTYQVKVTRDEPGDLFLGVGHVFGFGDAECSAVDSEAERCNDQVTIRVLAREVPPAPIPAALAETGVSMWVILALALASTVGGGLWLKRARM